MRDRERRLQRVTTRMTVRQRVAAMLAAGPGNTAVYDDIGRGLTPAGWAAFRRDCARLDQLNVMACVYLVRVDGTIDVLRLLVGWLATIRLTAAMADQLDDALDFWPPRRGPDGAAEQGRRATLAEYERRKESAVPHRLLKERIPVGLIPHVQARLLARHLRGDLRHYLPYLAR